MPKKCEDLPDKIADIVKKHHPETNLNKECILDISKLLEQLCPYVNGSGRASP